MIEQPNNSFETVRKAEILFQSDHFMTLYDDQCLINVVIEIYPLVRN